MGEVERTNDKAEQKTESTSKSWSDMAYCLIGMGACGAGKIAADAAKTVQEHKEVAAAAAGIAIGAIAPVGMSAAYSAARAGFEVGKAAAEAVQGRAPQPRVKEAEAADDDKPAQARAKVADGLNDLIKAGIGAGAGGVLGGGVDAMLTPVVRGLDKVAERHAQVHAGLLDFGTKIYEEVKSTPQDALNHLKNRPVQAGLELIISPATFIIDAKLRR